MITGENLTYTSLFSEEEMAKRLKEEAEQLRKEKLRKTTKEELQQEIDSLNELVEKILKDEFEWKKKNFVKNTIIIALLLLILL